MASSTENEMADLKLPADSEADVEEYSGGPEPLVNAASMLKRGEVPPRVTVRTFLSWFDAQRRGSFIVWYIRQHLDKLGIATDPDFNSVWIDAEIAFILKPVAAEEPLIAVDTSEVLGGTPVAIAPSNIVQPVPEAVLVSGATEDPTYRIGKLDAANKPVTSVAPNQPIETAITLMLANGFSQLPVMQGERAVKGMLTLEDIGARFGLGKVGSEVRHFMTTAQIISSEKSLFAALEMIAQYQYVLVRAPDDRLTGIVTAFDLSRQFQQLSEPFLLLSEIEQHIRALIADKFTPSELKAACDPNDGERKVENVADLTIGEYIRLLENPSNWEKLALRVDRVCFIEQLQAIRRIRNDVMHFDPDPLGSDDLATLRRFSMFAQSLRELGAF
jgi:CBS domain-containing protein